MKIKETKTKFIAVVTEDNERGTTAKVGDEMGQISKKTGKFIGAIAFQLPLLEKFDYWKATQPTKELTLTVKLTFSEKFDQEHLQAIVNNVAYGIRHTVYSEGITPDDAEYFTEKIEVTGENYTINIDTKW